MLAGLMQPPREGQQIEPGWDARRAELIKDLEAERAKLLKKLEAERIEWEKGQGPEERLKTALGCVSGFGPLLGAVLALGTAAVVATALWVMRYRARS
jgi:hypothetical protein